MVQVPTKRTRLPSSSSRSTRVTDRTSSTSLSPSAALLMERPCMRRISPCSAKKASTRGMFSSARMCMGGSVGKLPMLDLLSANAPSGCTSQRVDWSASCMQFGSPEMPAEQRLRRVRSELRALFALALPMMIAQLANTAMGFVDTVMSGRVSPHDLAAVALGNSIWVPVFLLTTGVVLATTPNVAKRFGAGQHEQIGPLVRQALWMGLGVGCLAAVAMWNAEPLLHLLDRKSVV